MMKVLLFHGNRPFNLYLKMKYLKEKGIDFWVYHYEDKFDQYRKIPLSKIKKAKLNEWDTFIGTVDLGDVIPDVFGSPESHKGCFLPKRDDYRFDKDLIVIVEREKDLFINNIEVVKVRKGEKFRILHDDSCDIEFIEMEKDVKWIESKD